jgi:transcriptional regulator with XRE-family HTH domain
MTQNERSEKYGAMLRSFREQGPNKTSLGALARHLGLTAPYLSDVELGRRSPLAPAHTIKAAEFLGVDPQPLLLAAIEGREAVEFKTPATAKGRSAIAMLQRRAHDLSDEQWERIEHLAHGGKNK